MKTKIEKLHNWLRGHVISPSTPKEIVLSNFEFDKDEFSGSFNLTLDNVRFTQIFDFSVDMSGRYQIHPPMHFSPLGVPASYASIELTDETSNSIEKLINQFFPKVKPFGIDKTTDEFIDRNTSMRQRIINYDELNLALNELLNKNFELRASIK